MAEEAKRVLLEEDRRYDCDIQRRLLNDARDRGCSEAAARNDGGVETLERNDHGAGDTLSSNITPPPPPTTITKNLLHLRDRLFEVLNTTDNEVENGEEKSLSSISHTNTTDTTTVELDLDLYRCLWVTCLLLLDIITHLNISDDHDCGSSNDVNNTEDDDSSIIENQKRFMIMVCDRCSVLVNGIQQKQKLANDSGGKYSTGDRIVEDDIRWDRLVHRWTVGKNESHAEEDVYAGHDDDEEDNQHILSFTREQLIEEEKELIQMASTPIPNKNP